MAVVWSGLDAPYLSENVNGRLHRVYRVVGTDVEPGDLATIGGGKFPRIYTLTLAEIARVTAGSSATVDPILYKSPEASENELGHIVSNGSGPVANFRVQTWLFVTSTEGGDGSSDLVVDPGLDDVCDRLEIEITIIEGHAR